VDDLFDYQADSGTTGKPVGHDLAEGKVTLPLIAALRSATEADRKKLRRLALNKRWTPERWAELKTLVEKCGGFAYARDRARTRADEARRILDGEPAGIARRALDRAVDYAVRRDR
jgi:octaprenyl-diphosphate synthase